MSFTVVAILTVLSRAGHVRTILIERHIPMTSVSEGRAQLVFDPDPLQREWLRFLQEKESFVLIGARNKMFNISLDDMTVTSEITLPVSHGRKASESGCRTLMSMVDADFSLCTGNFIRSVIPVSSEELLVCGSNAGQASCKSLVYVSAEERWIVDPNSNDRLGSRSTLLVPALPWLNVSLLVAGPDLSVYFGGCVIDYVRRFRCVIYRTSINESNPSLSTGESPLSLPRFRVADRGRPMESRIYPNFVAHFEVDQYVYWIFTEVAQEITPFLYKSISRVARQCTNDMSNKYLFHESFQEITRLFATLFKATLECSVQGKFVHSDFNTINTAGYHTFYFDEIAGASKFGTGSVFADGHLKQKIIYGVFNTHRNSIRGSAICAYEHQAMDEVFRGSIYLLDSNIDISTSDPWQRSWEIRDFKGNAQGMQHPATCDNTLNRTNSADYGDNRLLVSSIMPITKKPIFFQTDHRYIMTQIVVDFQVQAQNGRYYDVLHVGTDDGNILKLVNLGVRSSATFSIIERRTFSKEVKAVAELRLMTRNDPLRSRILLVNTFDNIVKLSVEACNQRHTCESCVALRDPYCSWNLEVRRCVPSYNSKDPTKYVQSIEVGTDARCYATAMPALSTLERTTPSPIRTSLHRASASSPSSQATSHVSSTNRGQATGLQSSISSSRSNDNGSAVVTTGTGAGLLISSSRASSQIKLTSANGETTTEFQTRSSTTNLTHTEASSTNRETIPKVQAGSSSGHLSHTDSTMIARSLLSAVTNSSSSASSNFSDNAASRATATSSRDVFALSSTSALQVSSSSEATGKATAPVVHDMVRTSMASSSLSISMTAPYHNASVTTDSFNFHISSKSATTATSSIQNVVTRTPETLRTAISTSHWTLNRTLANTLSGLSGAGFSTFVAYSSLPRGSSELLSERQTTKPGHSTEISELKTIVSSQRGMSPVISGATYSATTSRASHNLSSATIAGGEKPASTTSWESQHVEDAEGIASVRATARQHEDSTTPVEEVTEIKKFASYEGFRTSHADSRTTDEATLSYVPTLLTEEDIITSSFLSTTTAMTRETTDEEFSGSTDCCRLSSTAADDISDAQELFSLAPGVTEGNEENDPPYDALAASSSETWSGLDGTTLGPAIAAAFVFLPSAFVLGVLAAIRQSKQAEVPATDATRAAT